VLTRAADTERAAAELRSAEAQARVAAAEREEARLQGVFAGTRGK
jgi:hypothetical protein